jgi:hypothetical protein
MCRMGPQHLRKRTRWPTACASESGQIQTLNARTSLPCFVKPSAAGVTDYKSGQVRK